MEIAREILTQLGGNRFAIMTGSHQFMNMKDGLLMRLRRNKTGANYLRIKLTSMDVYEMEFFSMRNGHETLKASYVSVYNDQLQEIFTDATGLYTRL